MQGIPKQKKKIKNHIGKNAYFQEIIFSAFYGNVILIISVIICDAKVNAFCMIHVNPLQ